MPSRMNPYINFEKGAREAMEFYREVFGGTLIVDTYGEYGFYSDTPNADLVAHSILETPSGFRLMGNDTPPDAEYSPGLNVSISLSGNESTDGGELRGYWEKLSAEGTVTMPLAKQVWGDHFGMCTDKFGVNWMVNIAEV